MARGGFASIESMAAQAEGYIAQGRLQNAEAAFRELIGQTHVIDYEYDDWLRRLAELYVQLERPREAGYVYLYLHYFDLARNRFPGDEGLAARARVCEVEKRWEAAAELYGQANRQVHAAVALEKASKHEAAAEVWGNLINDP